MREILFTGKVKETGEWIEGFYAKHQDSLLEGIVHHYILAQEKSKNGLLSPVLTWYDVIPETIGQYTGLTDKNGMKIFEGDIVKTQPFYDRPYSKTRKSKQFIGVVKYRVRTFSGSSFYAKQDYDGEWGLDFCEELGKYNHYSWGELWNCEIIGNIHDNPELVKGDKIKWQLENLS